MRIVLVLMVLFFIEIILEAGLHINSTLGAGISVKNILIYSLFLWAVYRWYNEAAVYRDTSFVKLTVLFVAFVVYAILSLTIPVLFTIPNYDLRQGVLTLKGGLIDPFLCFIIFWVFAKRYLTKPDLILRILLVIVSVFCFLMIVERMIPSVELFGVDDSSELRLNGPFGEPNQTAAVFSFCLPMAISLAFIRGKSRIFYAAASMCLLMGIVITGSRGGILGAGVGCLYLLWTIRHQLALSNKVLMIVTAPFLTILAWIILPDSSRDLILLRFSFVNESDIDFEGASAGRIYLWRVGLELWRNSPIFGQGWSSFHMIVGNASHNIYLDYLVSLGIVGLAIGLALYWRLFMFFKTIVKRHRDRAATLLLTGTSAGVVALLTSLAFVNLYTAWIPVWCMLGAAAGYGSALMTVERVRFIRSQA